ncbi:MAG: ribonuclease H-like domain-containing protein [Chloroflexota bacterium]
MERPPTLNRRLASYRAAIARVPIPAGPAGDLPRLVRDDLAERLALVLGGEVIRHPSGSVVRCESPTRSLPIDRERLARLPGQPPPNVPLVCLDTETTGLATAAGTMAFLVGLGWWEGDRFRQVQLALPDQPDEPALLNLVARSIPADGWLVTYNGRGFDWPLLVTRYRLARRDPPAHAGHLDLLPLVRRLFRHRMDDARLRTAEAVLLGLHRVGDVDGWEIPGRYLAFLRGAPAEPLAEVARHNDQDVRSLARLLIHVERALGDRNGRALAPAGDLGGLARAYARERRLDDALDCLELAAASEVPAPRAPVADAPARPPGNAAGPQRAEDDAWWEASARPDFGGRPRRPLPTAAIHRREAFADRWTGERIAADRAHILRRLGRTNDAVAAWTSLAAGSGRLAVLAAIEISKLCEHRLADPGRALVAARRGLDAADRRRRLGRPEPDLEADLLRRAARLRRRLARGAPPRPTLTAVIPGP